MKAPRGRKIVLLGLLIIAAAGQARAQADDLEIAGVTVSGGAAEFMLIQKSTGTGRWVKVGQSFAGYTVKAYDDQTGRLTVAKDQTTRVLTLKKSTVQATGAGTGTPPAPEQQKALTHNLRQLSAAADQYFLEQGVSTVTVGQLIGPEPNKYIKELKPAAGETYPANMVIEQGKPIRVKTASGFEAKYEN